MLKVRRFLMNEPNPYLPPKEDGLPAMPSRWLPLQRPASCTVAGIIIGAAAEALVADTGSEVAFIAVGGAAAGFIAGLFLHLHASSSADPKSRDIEQNPYQSPLFDEGCLPELLGKRSACYRSTPEYLRSFAGRFLDIYTDKGELILTPDSLTFEGKREPPRVIPLHAILSISVGHYSRWAKPIKLNYIAVRHQQRDIEQTTLLTPTRSGAAPVWETNKIVADWKHLLDVACMRHT
jgi:hypothetical protein